MKETREENYHRVGVLTIDLGKRAEAKPKQIEISVSVDTPATGQKPSTPVH
jgi:hypothetical protein